MSTVMVIALTDAVANVLVCAGYGWVLLQLLLPLVTLIGKSWLCDLFSINLMTIMQF